jgi:myo-inositol-1(or 4)-monophosphatase
MQTPLTFAAEIAQKTGELLLEHFNLMGTRADLKPDQTVITEADLAADKLITEAISTAFPQEDILSEEGNTAVDQLDRPIWVIDPLDGTTNFSLGLQIWGVSIARLVNGVPNTASLYFPALNELYTAEHGQGAFLNSEPIQVKIPDKDQPTAFFTCCSRTVRNYTVDIPYKTRILGSAAYDLCLTARGAAVMGFQATPKIWDLAAGWLLIQEAGGIVEILDGPAPFPLKSGTDYEKLSYPTIMAADRKLASKARAGIFKNRMFS